MAIEQSIEKDTLAALEKLRDDADSVALELALQEHAARQRYKFYAAAYNALINGLAYE